MVRGVAYKGEKEEQVASHARPGRLAPPVDKQRRRTKAWEYVHEVVVSRRLARGGPAGLSG